MRVVQIHRRSKYSIIDLSVWRQFATVLVQMAHKIRVLIQLLLWVSMVTLLTGAALGWSVISGQPEGGALLHAAALTPTPIAGHAGSVEGGLSDGTLRRLAVPVLMYHYVSVPPEDADVYRRDLSVSPDKFRRQMEYLSAQGYRTVSLYDVNRALRWGAPLPEKSVVLTFDDGYLDAYAEAFPVLKELGFTATFFVITSRLDEGHPAYISWMQAREMADAGMSIESHTKDHPALLGRDLAYLQYQIQGSVESIEAHVGYRPRMFCFPGGRWDRATLDALELFGIWAAVTTEGGIEHTSDEIHLIRRVRVSGDTDLMTFAALLRWDWDRSAT